jgi:hypothetical protein
MLFTLSNNYGTYNINIPFPESRPVQSIFLEICKPLQRFQGLELLLKVAADRGDLYGNNGGISFAVRKNGGLFKRSKKEN